MFAAMPASAEQGCLSLRVIAQYDADNSLSIDRGEFQEIAALRFDTVDHDEDGIVSLSDLPTGRKYHPTVRENANRRADGTEWMDKQLFLASLDGFFAYVDQNGNGRLSLSEYRSLCRSGFLF